MDEKMGRSQDMVASREQATSMIQRRIKQLYDEAHGLQCLLDCLPMLSREADEALWNLLTRCR